MKNFHDALEMFPFLLTEGAILERVKRSPEISMDPLLMHSTLIYDQYARDVLEKIYRGYLDVAKAHNIPILFCTPTWRANHERIRAKGLTEKNVNADNFAFLESIRNSYGSFSKQIFIGGLIGCKGDAYKPKEALSRKQASAFHEWQIGKLAGTHVDFICAVTLPAFFEAIGIAEALSRSGKPYLLSFVIREDGCLLDGIPLATAIHRIDSEREPKPACYMVNCVHPSKVAEALEKEKRTFPFSRLVGIQGNTSRRDPTELDGLNELDTEDPKQFAQVTFQLHDRFGFKILGGCCGTDERHIEEIAKQVSLALKGVQ